MRMFSSQIKSRICFSSSFFLPYCNLEGMGGSKKNHITLSNDNQMNISPAPPIKWSPIPEKQAVLCIDHHWCNTKGIFFVRAGPDLSINQFSFIFSFLQRRKKIKLNKILRKRYLQDCYKNKAEGTMLSPCL